MPRIIHVQPAVPEYRVGFFNRLAERPEYQVLVYHTPQDEGGQCNSLGAPSWPRKLGRVRTVLPGVQWQSGVLAINLSKEDVVVVSGAPRCLSNLALLLKAKLLGAKTVWWGHYWSATSKAWRFSIRIRLMNLADAVLLYTDKELAEYRRRGGTKAARAFALNNGLETGKIKALRAGYACQSRPCDLLFIGRLTQKASLSILLKALVDARLSGVRLQVVGDGDQRANLQVLANTLGISSRIVWHGRCFEEARIARIANQCRLFVYPGAVGLSLIHAMAYGLPAIVHSNNREQMPEIAAFAPDCTGTAFKQANPASLAYALHKAINDTERLNTWSRNCVDITDQTFNAEDMASRFFDLIKTL